MLAPKRYAEHITIWDKKQWERWIIEEHVQDPRFSQGAADQQSTGSAQVRPKILSHDTGPNPFGRVPMVFCRWDEPMQGPVFTGLPQILTLAQIARKGFNQQSELDYQMRQQVFGQLVGPQRKDGVTKGVESVGAGNFLEEPWEAKGCWRYIAPSGECAATYEKALERDKRDAYRIALIDPGEGRQAETAESRRLRFQQTEAMLSTAAGNLDKWEADLYRLIGPLLHVAPAAIDKIGVRRKRTYAVQSLDERLDSSLKGLELPLGPLAKTAIVQRTIRSLLPDTPEAELVLIDDEVMQVIEDLFQARTKSLAALAGGIPGGGTPAQPDPNAPAAAAIPPPSSNKESS